jgi:hypothetical protein
LGSWTGAKREGRCPIKRRLRLRTVKVPFVARQRARERPRCQGDPNDATVGQYKGRDPVGPRPFVSLAS